MENKQYKRKFEFWHKGPRMTIKCHIEGKLECTQCRSSDLDVSNFYATNVMQGGNMTVHYFCRDCDFTEDIEYPLISRKESQQIERESDKIDNLLKNNLQFDKL